MPFVAGNEIDAHCPKCKKDMNHTVMVVHGGLVHEVRCTQCSEVHPYKRPQVSKKPVKAKKTTTRKRTKKATAKVQGPPQEWQDYALTYDADQARSYSVKETFAANEIISHKKFGLGVVTALHDDGKLTVAFKDEYKKLVHGRR